MKDLIFGAAYYEEYAQTERLTRDMMLMKEAGMNTIRIAESTWSVEEPRCGEFDFSHVIRVIEAAAQYGINVIVGTPTYAIPKWLAELDPEILGKNRFGSRQNMDITNPTYRFYAERIIRELVSRTVDYENVIGFQIDNETKHYGINNARIREGFQNWLRERFGSVSAVNDAFVLRHWSLSVSSFSELPDPAGTVNGGYACAFEEYRRELAAEFLKWQSAIVSEYKREDQFITHNMDYEWKSFVGPNQQGGQSAGVQPDLNDYEAAKSLTLAGTDIYCPTDGLLTGQEIAFGGDLMRPLKRNPYLVLESHAQAFTGMLPWPGQLRLMALAHLASGACGLMYWPWASIHGGIESYWKGVLSHDGQPGTVYNEVSEIGSVFRKLSLELENKQRCRIALIISPEALHALRWFPTDQNMSYNDVVRCFHQAIYELNLECDILYDREQNWEGYQLLIMPELYCTSDEMLFRIRHYVSEGGSVFAGFRSFFADENGKIRTGQQPYGLTDVFGLHYDLFTKNDNHVWMELLEPETAETLRENDDPHWSKYAAFTHNRFGMGHAWYLGYDVSVSELKSMLLQAAENAGIHTLPVQWPLICRQRGNLSFLMNFSDRAEQVEAPVSGVDLLTNVFFAKGDKFSLNAWDAVVIQKSF